MQSFSHFLIRGEKNEIKNEAPHPPTPLMRKKALHVLTDPSHNEGREGVGQQMLGAREVPPGWSTTLRLPAAAAGKFKSTGGILKTVLFFSYLVETLWWAGFQQDIWTGVLSGVPSSRGKSDASCLAIKRHAFSPSPRKFETAGVKGERKMNGANSDFYKVSGAGR